MTIPKPLKIIGIVFAVIVLLVAAAIITLSIMFPPEKVKAMVVPQLEKAVGRSVTVEHAGLSFFPEIGLRVHDLQIGNTSRPQFSQEPFLQLRDFILKVKLGPLFSRRVEIDAIVIRKPTVVVEVDSSGAFNYDDMAFMQKDTTQKKGADRPRGPMLPIPITLEKLTIEQARIVYNDMKAGQKFTLGRVDDEIAFDIDQELKNVKSTGQLSISDITVQTGATPKPLSGLAASLRHDVKVNVIDGELVINDLRASLQKVFLSLSGTVKNFNATPELDLSVKTDPIALADLLAEIPAALVPDIAKTRGEGEMQLGLTVKGALKKDTLPAINGQFSLKNGKIRHTALPQAIRDLNASIEFTENSLAVNQLGLKLGENPISLKAQVVNFKTPHIDAALDAVVNLDVVREVTKLPEGMTLGGTLKADIKAKGLVDPADPTKLDLKGKVLLDKVVTTTTAVTKPVEINGTVDLSSKKIGERLLVKIGASSMNFNGELIDYLSLVLPDSTKKYPRPRLNFTLASPLLNTDEFLPPADTSKKAAANKEQPRSQPQSPALLLAAPLPAMDYVGTITTSRLIYQGIELRDLTMKVNGVSDVLDLNVRAGMFKGTMTNDLRLDAKNIRDLKIKTALKFDNVEINEVAHQMKSQLPRDLPLSRELQNLDKTLYGKGVLSTDFVAHGGTTEELLKTLDGNVYAKLANGKMSGQTVESVMGVLQALQLAKSSQIEFNDMRLRARIKDEKVFVDSMKVMSRFPGDWDVSGEVGFDCRMDMQIANRLTKENSSRLLAVKNEALGMLGQLAQKHLSDQAAGLVSQSLNSAVEGAGPQADRDGRVNVELSLGGTVSKPVPSGLRFKQGDGSSSQARTPAQPVKQQLQQKAVEAARQQAGQAVQEAAKKAEQSLPADVKKLEQDAKKALGNKLKGLKF